MKKNLILFISILLLFTVNLFAQCPPEQTRATIDVSTDNWCCEIYWELNPTGSTATIFSDGNATNTSFGRYSDNTTINNDEKKMTKKLIIE